MSERDSQWINGHSLAVTLVHGCPTTSSRQEASMCVPGGHHLSRARIRHLAQSERVAVCDEGCVAGLAAYRKADSEVRVVHEFLLNRRLDDRGADVVVQLLLSTLDMLCFDDQVHCLMILLGPEISLVAFEQHAYTKLSTDANGAWLQKRLDVPPWIGARSHRVH